MAALDAARSPAKADVLSAVGAMLSAMRDNYDVRSTAPLHPLTCSQALVGDPAAARDYAAFCKQTVAALRLHAGAGINERSIPNLRLLAFTTPM